MKTVVTNYKDIGAYSSTPVMSKDAFNRLTDILKNAGELPADVNIEYSAIIDNTFAEAALK